MSEPTLPGEAHVRRRPCKQVGQVCKVHQERWPCRSEEPDPPKPERPAPDPKPQIKGWWACAVCRKAAPDYIARRQGKPLVSLPCGHENPDGQTWVRNPHYFDEQERD